MSFKETFQLIKSSISGNYIRSQCEYHNFFFISLDTRHAHNNKVMIVLQETNNNIFHSLLLAFCNQPRQLSLLFHPCYTYRKKRDSTFFSPLLLARQMASPAPSGGCPVQFLQGPIELSGYRCPMGPHLVA